MATGTSDTEGGPPSTKIDAPSAKIGAPGNEFDTPSAARNIEGQESRPRHRCRIIAGSYFCICHRDEVSEQPGLAAASDTSRAKKHLWRNE